MMSKNDILRKIPQVDSLLQELGDSNVRAKDIRAVLNKLRSDVLSGKIAEIPSVDEILSAAVTKGNESSTFGFRRMINATGIVLHTNLGRAPLPPEVAKHVAQIAMGYCNLEYDIETGRRGSRMSAIQNRLTKLCGAEAAVCVNNNAAAVLLVLSALCAGGEVIVSRGELVEIGGSFRVPEVISQGGARLVEIGTTNKTHTSDYVKAICDSTSAILKVHTSNYRIVGFTEEVGITELSEITKESGLPLIYDLGGGALIELSQSEPTVQKTMVQGVDVLCFSGDKLLGGPQCGIIVGKKKYIDKIAKHPLYRALRMDKLTIAALEGMLMMYENGKASEIPTIALLTKSTDELKVDAEKLINILKPMTEKFSVSIVETSGQVGGGSLPTEEFPSFAVAITTEAMPLQELEHKLRQWDIPIVSRIYREQLLLDVRTVSCADFYVIADAVKSIFGGCL